MKVILLSLFICLSTLSQADVFVVNDTGDADQCNQTTCTLRGAIKDAMRTLGTDTINFDIPADAVNQNYVSGGSGNSAFFYWIIQPTQELPEILGITIDGTSADSSPLGNPGIVIDGSLAGTGTNQDPMDGLTLRGNSSVKGISFIYWDEAGLRIADGSNNLVTQSWFGLNLPYGLAPAPNRIGISYDSRGTGNAIHGTLRGTGNVISGNTDYGVASYYLSKNLTLFGNIIGADPEGQIAVPNDNIGVYIKGQNHQIGVPNLPLQKNLISGNLNAIQVSGYPYEAISGIEVANNIIGLNFARTASISNLRGIYIQWGRGFVIRDNIIAGNQTYGINLAPAISDVKIENNRIGINQNGTQFSNNTGIMASGGAERVTIGPNNIIAKNNRGIYMSGDSTGQTHIVDNQIYNNDKLGIDLELTGMNLNDAGDFDAGPNRLQNFPDITAVQYDSNGNRIGIELAVDSHPGASDYPITVDIYHADSDGEEGQTWLAATTFTEAHYFSGSSINRSLFADAPVSQGDLIVTTATDAAGRTSEFSPPTQLAGDADFAISCDTTTLTMTSAMNCTIDCQADAINGWSEEPVLNCENPDSQCMFLPSDIIPFTQSTVPFTIQLTHQTTAPGIYTNEITATAHLQGGPVVRSEIVQINQLTVSDYLFKDGFDGIVCQ